jgi:Holliday junction resolvase
MSTHKINSRQKGARGERQWRDELRANGYDARRGQQFSGSPDSPDVVCESLPWIHFEVKHTERLNLYDAMEQAQRDCGSAAPTGQKVPIVVYRRNNRGWLVTMTADVFFEFLRGNLPPSTGVPVTAMQRDEQNKNQQEKVIENENQSE